ncbi:MAG: SDR family NAD(P)-dependent oxidoreductase [Fuscovulum sp.]|nr:MAG: SDR family NAD(P)-dependent oxidoreductase [Fuscovulum sp.]
MSDAQVSERLRQGVAVVTGANRGLGEALALELAGLGVTVAAIGRDEAGLRAVAAKATSGRVHPVVLDLKDAAAVPEAFAGIARDLGPVTLLINNAAIYPRRDFLEEGTADFMATVAINLGGVAACTHAALMGMVETGFGRILNVSTFADIQPVPASAGYAVSKGAGRILTRALVADIGDRFPGIVISEWMPGILATRMGVPGGLPAREAAIWGARLALWHDRSLNGRSFVLDRELLETRSLKRRLLDKLARRSPVPRRL